MLLVSLAVVGCSKTSNSPEFNVAGAPTVQFNAPDMMCPEGCGVKVKEILSEQPGAKEVIVDFDAKTATVAIEDGGKFDANAAVAALVDHGFKNSSVKSDGPAKMPAVGAGDRSCRQPPKSRRKRAPVNAASRCWNAVCELFVFRVIEQRDRQHQQRDEQKHQCCAASRMFRSARRTLDTGRRRSECRSSWPDS